MQRIVAATVESQLPLGSPDSELTPETKRLLLSAHLSFVFKKLRRGLCVEEHELLALLPFTVRDGWQPDDTASDEPDDTAAVIAASDADWARRVAEVAVR